MVIKINEMRIVIKLNESTTLENLNVLLRQLEQFNIQLDTYNECIKLDCNVNEEFGIINKIKALEYQNNKYLNITVVKNVEIHIDSKLYKKINLSKYL